MGEHEAKTPLLTNQFYDVLKFVALVLLPASGALYFGVAEIWGLPNAQEVVGTIVVVDTFLGSVLGLSSVQHKRQNPVVGTLDVITDHEGIGKSFSLNVDEDPYDLDQKKQVTFKVNPIQEERRLE